jgi:surfactin synthase thioesterase subunit
MVEASLQRSPWVTTWKPAPAARHRLLCFHHAGGSGAAFSHWPASFPSLEVSAVTLPGRERRFTEPLLTDAATAGAQIALALARLGDRPWIFYGHSMGAIIAFETIREMRRRAQPLPRHLFVSGCGAPHIQDEGDWHKAPEGQIIAQLREMGGMSDEILDHPELVELLMPVLRADAAMTELYAYAPAPPLEVPVTAFYATDDEIATAAAVRAWEQHTARSFVCHAVAGGHMFVTQPEFVSRLAKLASEASTLT